MTAPCWSALAVAWGCRRPTQPSMGCAALLSSLTMRMLCARCVQGMAARRTGARARWQKRFTRPPTTWRACSPCCRSSPLPTGMPRPPPLSLQHADCRPSRPPQGRRPGSSAAQERRRAGACAAAGFPVWAATLEGKPHLACRLGLFGRQLWPAWCGRGTSWPRRSAPVSLAVEPRLREGLPLYPAAAAKLV